MELDTHQYTHLEWLWFLSLARLELKVFLRLFLAYAASTATLFNFAGEESSVEKETEL